MQFVCLMYFMQYINRIDYLCVDKVRFWLLDDWESCVNSLSLWVSLSALAGHHSHFTLKSGTFRRQTVLLATALARDASYMYHLLFSLWFLLKPKVIGSLWRR